MIGNLIDLRKDILYHYSPYSFLPKSDKNKIFKHSIKDTYLNGVAAKEIDPIIISIEKKTYIFLIKSLKWDSNYFEIPTYKLIAVLYDNCSHKELVQAVKKFIRIFFTGTLKYCFSEIPSEDIWTIQALNENGFKLVETRLTYFLDLLHFSNERYNTRQANIEDIENLKRVAREMRNIYDRFHSDPIFELSKADEFLSTYIEESIKGFANYVMVPNQQGVSPDAFLTANYLKSEWDLIGQNISKMVLSAVSSETCKGWYIKLISEMAYHLKTMGSHYAFMHPATTNRAVIHSYEKLGCKYGKCIHVLTYTK